MTAIQPPCVPETDRFARTVQVSDPPDKAAGRRRYWDDTVMEALGELRRGMCSNRESVATLALLTTIDLEKHKMRHGRPVSGTHVPYLGELDEPPTGRPTLAEGRSPSLPAGATHSAAGTWFRQLAACGR